VFVVNFKSNPSYEDSKEALGGITLLDKAKDSPFLCPLTGVEAGFGHRFVAIKTCGCALSEKIMKECPSSECLNCSKPFTKDDVVLLNPSDEEREKLRDALHEKRKAAKKEKKEKKKAKAAEETLETKPNNQTDEITTTTTSVTEEKKRKTSEASLSGNIKKAKEVMPVSTPSASTKAKVPEFANKGIFSSIFVKNAPSVPTSVGLTSTKLFS
jgi:hypothetical protein